MPDRAIVGALEPPDAFVDKCKFREALSMIAPVCRDNQMKVEGKIYGFPDDGDVLIMHCRRDTFEDPADVTAFKAQPGYDLAPPTTWDRFSDIGQFISAKMAPDIYGAGMLRQPGNAQFLFQDRFRVEGGKFFAPGAMKAAVNTDVGVKAFTELVAENNWMPPGVEQWGFGDAFSAFLAGDIAMTIFWPPAAAKAPKR
jgi:multiple sugar transport system substrate-binding protein